MVDQIKAKLKVSAVTGQNWGSSDPDQKTAETIDLYAVYSPDKDSENYTYSQYTPNAHLNIVVTNPDAFGFFVPGAEYVVTFERATA